MRNAKKSFTCNLVKTASDRNMPLLLGLDLLGVAFSNKANIW